MAETSNKASRRDFSVLYALIYDAIESHITLASVKVRGWGIWEQWKSNGLRKRMTSFVSVSKIIYGRNINLTTFMEYLYSKFPFLNRYISYIPHDRDINVVHYTIIKAVREGKSKNSPTLNMDSTDSSPIRENSSTTTPAIASTSTSTESTQLEKTTNIEKDDVRTSKKVVNFHLPSDKNVRIDNPHTPIKATDENTNKKGTERFGRKP